MPQPAYIPCKDLWNSQVGYSSAFSPNAALIYFQLSVCTGCNALESSKHTQVADLAKYLEQFNPLLFFFLNGILL